MSLDDTDLAGPRSLRAPGGSRSGLDDGTKRLAFIAGGLGGLLVLLVGGWSLLGRHSAGIPIIQAAPGPMKVKPLNPGGMQVLGAQPLGTDGPMAQSLAPGPEAAQPQALQAQVSAARHGNEAGDGKPAAHAVPAAAPVSQAAPPVARAADAGAATGGGHAAAETAPAGQAAPDSHDGARGDVPAPAIAADAGPGANPPETGHAVQLAALPSEAAAQAEWARLSHQAPSLLGDRKPAIVRVMHDGHVFYRLRTGGFATIAAATEFCGRARANGLACTLADF